MLYNDNKSLMSCCLLGLSAEGLLIQLILLSGDRNTGAALIPKHLFGSAAQKALNIGDSGISEDANFYSNGKCRLNQLNIPIKLIKVPISLYKFHLPQPANLFPS